MQYIVCIHFLPRMQLFLLLTYLPCKHLWPSTNFLKVPFLCIISLTVATCSHRLPIFFLGIVDTRTLQTLYHYKSLRVAVHIYPNMFPVLHKEYIHLIHNNNFNWGKKVMVMKILTEKRITASRKKLTFMHNVSDYCLLSKATKFVARH